MLLYHQIAGVAGNSEVIPPTPAFAVINGGSQAVNKLAMQEFMVLPVLASCFREEMHLGAEVYFNLKNVIKVKYRKYAINVGDEDRFSPNILENEEAPELLKTAIAKASYPEQVAVIMDVAASEFYRSLARMTWTSSFLKTPAGTTHQTSWLTCTTPFIQVYPVLPFEDPLTRMTEKLGRSSQLVQTSRCLGMISQ